MPCSVAATIAAETPLPDTSATVTQTESLQPDGVEEVAADGQTGDGSGLEHRVRQHRQRHRHQAAVDLGRDRKLLTRLARLVLFLGQQRVVQQRRGLRRNRIQQLMVDFAEIAGAYLAVEIEQPQQLVGPGRRHALAQRNAINRPDAVHQHALPAGRVLAGERVRHDEFLVAVDGALHGPARDGGVLRNRRAVGAEALRQPHVVGLAEEHKAAFHPRQLQRQLQQRVQNIFHGGTGVELAGSPQQEIELLHLPRRRLAVWRSVFERDESAQSRQQVDPVGGLAAGVFLRLLQMKTELRRVGGAELDDVVGLELRAFHALTVAPGAVGAGAVEHEVHAALARDQRMLARDERLGKDDIVLRRTPQRGAVAVENHGDLSVRARICQSRYPGRNVHASDATLLPREDEVRRLRRVLWISQSQMPQESCPTMRSPLFRLAALGTLLPLSSLVAQNAPSAQKQMDRDLLEIPVPQLEALYAAHRYTVTEVTRWYLARIARYNGIYRDVETLDQAGALASAARLDQEFAAHPGAPRPPLWGVPVVIKANTSVEGLPLTDGWKGYTLPGHEFIAPKDATIVAHLKAAGVVILGKTNMPDFAASDTNRSTSFGRTGNAYDVRFSPGGSSGGTVTAVTSNEAVLGNGTDTGNSIRMPAATSAVIGVFPTRGLVSIAGIAPLDWLLDNTGPIARDVTSAAIALTVMAGEDPADPRTLGSAARAQPGPYTQYLQQGALQGKRFGVPAFILAGAGIPFQGICPETPAQFAADRRTAEIPLTPATRAAFLASLEGLRQAGATIVFADDILPDSFAETASHVCTLPYLAEGTNSFLANYGPAQYHSAEQYSAAVGSPLPDTILNGMNNASRRDRTRIVETTIEGDPHARKTYTEPRERALAQYVTTLNRLHLDGYVYPATQMPPPDETMAQAGEPGNLSGGPHSDTSWVNILGVPAVVVSGGFYPGGLPFGLELSARPWRDGDLLGWAFAYEQATHHRHPPVLVEQGLLPNADRND